MTYDRNKVIDKINGLKGKRKSKGYVSNEKIAESIFIYIIFIGKITKKRKPGKRKESMT